ncbi:MAG TPA: hypothetical protein VMY36_01330 [Patescibacteria group bacterium]|nr:hypothetical protein [Patescibacteria group bacterium]
MKIKLCRQLGCSALKFMYAILFVFSSGFITYHQFIIWERGLKYINASLFLIFVINISIVILSIFIIKFKSFLFENKIIISFALSTFLTYSGYIYLINRGIRDAASFRGIVYIIISTCLVIVLVWQKVLEKFLVLKKKTYILIVMAISINLIPQAIQTAQKLRIGRGVAISQADVDLIKEFKNRYNEDIYFIYKSEKSLINCAVKYYLIEQRKMFEEENFTSNELEEFFLSKYKERNKKTYFLYGTEYGLDQNGTEYGLDQRVQEDHQVLEETCKKLESHNCNCLFEKLDNFALITIENCID